MELPAVWRLASSKITGAQQVSHCKTGPTLKVGGNTKVQVHTFCRAREI